MEKQNVMNRFCIKLLLLLRVAANTMSLRDYPLSKETQKNIEIFIKKEQRVFFYE